MNVTMRPRLVLPRKRPLITRRSFLNGTAVLIAAPSIVRAQSIGSGSGINAASVPASGGGGYVAKAVQFAINRAAGIDLLTSPITKMSYCGWWRTVSDGSVAFSAIAGAESDAFAFTGFATYNDYNSPGDIAIDFISPSGADEYTVGTFSGHGVDDHNWHLISYAVDLNHSAGSKVSYLLIDGVSQLDSSVTFDTGGALILGLSKLYLPDWQSGTLVQSVIEVSDQQIWFGQTIDFSDATNVACFITGGKPVNPAVAAARFGQPDLLFSGDSSGYLMNQGSLGGSLSVLTNFFNGSSLGPSGLPPKSIPVAGLTAGMIVGDVFAFTVPTLRNVRHTSLFESTISVDGQIQQLSGPDLTIGVSFPSISVFVVTGTLADASTSPSN